MEKSKHAFELVSGNNTLLFDEPVIMGILNLTPDSFYEGSRITSDSELLKQAEKMLKEGAQILDIGGISTRPGATDVGEAEELQRIIGAIVSLSEHFPQALISVDTYRSGIAEKAIAAGAHIINDISGGTFDSEMIHLLSRLQVPYILMHIKGTPQHMQQNPHFENVLAEVSNFFKNQLEKFRNAGIRSTIILDPGFGFGKSLEHNFSLLAGLESFRINGCPILAGLSRKSMVNRVLQTTPNEALNGTTVLNTIALINGTNILRVHDVKEAKEAVNLVERYLEAGKGSQ